VARGVASFFCWTADGKAEPFRTSERHSREEKVLRLTAQSPREIITFNDTTAKRKHYVYLQKTYYAKMRLCRLMCGKAVPFRQVFLKFSEAAPHVSDK